MKRIFAASALLLAMTGCMGGSKNVPLAGTIWKLSSMEGIPATAISAEVDAFTLMFESEEKMVAGRTNCNRFFGKYEEMGSELEFTEMGMTRMACPDMQYEDVFVKMLDEVDGFQIKGDELTLMDDKRSLAVFRAEKPEAQK